MPSLNSSNIVSDLDKVVELSRSLTISFREDLEEDSLRPCLTNMKDIMQSVTILYSTSD